MQPLHHVIVVVDTAGEVLHEVEESVHLSAVIVRQNLVRRIEAFDGFACSVTQVIPFRTAILE